MVTLAVLLFIVSCFLCLYRIVTGPGAHDRFISLITLTMLSVGFMCAYALIYNASFLIDITLDAFLLTFVGAMAVGKYLEGRELDE